MLKKCAFLLIKNIKLMPIITLPDGNNLTFPDKVTGLDVAEKISKSLAKQAMVISVDGDLKYLRQKILKAYKLLVMIRHIYWQWQYKNYFQVHKLLLDQLLKMVFI